MHELEEAEIQKNQAAEEKKRKEQVAEEKLLEQQLAQCAASDALAARNNAHSFFSMRQKPLKRQWPDICGDDMATEEEWINVHMETDSWVVLHEE